MGYAGISAIRLLLQRGAAAGIVPPVDIEVVD
jgi:hypothetical protein